MRGIASLSGLCGLLACLLAEPAWARECAVNRNAVGTSRILVVDPAAHARLGSFQYPESLPLEDGEVVLTFDDGPLPPYTARILDILARECVKATFFMVGQMAQSFPRLARRVYEEGHTVANHSQTHPYDFHRMPLADAAKEVDQGFASIAAAVGGADNVAPFFRFPGLHRQSALERHLASHNIIAWSVDVMGDDWTRVGPSEIVTRVLARLQARKKGILMLHDIKPATVLALPELLRELKSRGYRVVHAVPATHARPETPGTPEQWRVARFPTTHPPHGRTPAIWPRAAAPSNRAAGWQVASLASSAAGDGSTLIALARANERIRSVEDANARPREWPAPATVEPVTGVDLLPAPSAETFRYAGVMIGSVPRGHLQRRVRSTNGAPTAADGSTAGVRPAFRVRTGDTGPTNISRSSKGPVGHQIQLTMPGSVADHRP